MSTTITGLPAGTTPSGTEVVPADQSGATVKITMAQIYAYVLATLGLTLPVSVANGGTGATTAAGARTNLGAGTATSPLTTKGDVWTYGSADARIAIGTNGQVLAADSAQTTGLVYIDNPVQPNLLINPNWQIDQINEGGLYTMSTGTQGPDGWFSSAAGAGVFKVRTLADPENAALKCMEITCATADVAIAAGDVQTLLTAVEGYDASALMWGTASALPITLQFKFKSSVTGVYGISVQNSARTRAYVTFITVANTSENEYSMTIPGDTSGTWLYTGGVGLYLQLTLAGGSTYQATAGAWTAGDVRTTAAQCNFMSNTANIAYLKRIQLIPGSLVQAYKPADIQKELAKCQRYYEKTFKQGVAVANASGDFNGSLLSIVPIGDTLLYWTWHFAVEKCSTVSPTTYNPTQANGLARNIGNSADSVGITITSQGTRSCAFYSGGGLSQNPYGIHATYNVRLS